MLTKKEAKNRAMMTAIESGHMPNLDLVWLIQQQELHQECFGRKQACSEFVCKWRAECQAVVHGEQPQTAHSAA